MVSPQGYRVGALSRPEYLDAQANQNQGWGQADPTEAEDLFAEHAGVVAPASCHQDIAEDYKGQPQEHQEVIPALKDELLSRFFRA